jgi:hypothetical protein
MSGVQGKDRTSQHLLQGMKKLLTDFEVFLIASVVKGDLLTTP